MPKKKFWITQIAIAFSLYLFFTIIVPVVPFDGDDWYFTGAMRIPIPLWGGFNPSKILPEVLEPLGGYFAAFIIYPVTRNYIRSINLSQALIIVIFIMIYLISFEKYLSRKFGSNPRKSIFTELFLCMSFFCVFKKENDFTLYGFWAQDLNCYFNYIIPGLLNMSMLFIMDKYTNFPTAYNKWSCDKKAIYWIGIYFSIFSSIQLNVIIAGYCSWMIIKNLFVDKTYSNITKFIHDNTIYLTIILIWIASLVFEANGARANMLSQGSGFNFLQSILQTIFLSWKLFSKFNKLMIAAAIFLLIYCITFNRRQISELEYTSLIEFLYLIILTMLYLLLLYSTTGGDYSSRTDAMWAVISFYLVVLSLSFNICLNHSRGETLAIPVLLLVFLCTVNQNRSYSSGGYNYDYNTCAKIDNYIIDQIVQADLSGKTSVDVQVPDEHNATNWPHPYNMAQWLQNTLYSHKIIKRRIKINFAPNEKVNDAFYFSTDTMEQFTDLEG